MVYTVATGLLRGRLASIWASLGCTLGIVPHLVATAVGLSAIMHVSATAFQVLKYAGAAYLLYLAWATWRDDSAFSAAEAEAHLDIHALKGVFGVKR